MLSIHISQLFVPHTTNTILCDIHCNITKGWTGIVGRNGSGKTTLAKAIAGLNFHYIGSIKGNDQAYYLDQTDFLSQEEFYEFLCDTSTDSGVWKSRLLVDWYHFEHWDNLSYGEKRRVQIAIALFTRPPIIILDEPTNHLDEFSQKIVVNALKSYTGIGILVSHNRELLNFLPNNILFLDSYKAHLYNGNFFEFLKHRTKEEIRAHKEYEIAKEEFQSLKREYKRRSLEANMANSKKSGSILDKKDNDSRAKLRLAILTGKDGKAGKLKAQMERRMEDTFNKLSLAKDKLPSKELVYKSKELEIPRKKNIFYWEKQRLDLGYIKLDLPSFLLTTNTKLGIKGNNGSGKTSLLNFLYRELKDLVTIQWKEDGTTTDNKSIYFIEQELEENEKNKLLEEVRNLSHSKMAEFLSILNYFHLSPDYFLLNNSFSPGEWKKLQIAWGILIEPDVWILDEPTNHLDLQTIESLESVLKNWNRCLVIVSHDKVFLDSVCGDFLELGNL